MSRIIAFALGMRVVLLHAHGAAGAVYAGPPNCDPMPKSFLKGSGGLRRQCGNTGEIYRKPSQLGHSLGLEILLWLYPSYTPEWGLPM